MKVVIVPNNISIGVFESQILGLFRHSNATNIFVSNEKERIRLLDNSLICNEIVIVGWLNLLKYSFKIKMFYTRDVFDFVKVFTFFLPFYLRISFEHDFRALVSEESYMRHNSKLRKIFLLSFEFFVYVFSSKIYCVSNNLKFRLKKIFYQKKIIVIPCCISNSEIQSNLKLSLKRKNSFVYVGSISAWQMFEESLLLYKEIQLEGKSLTIYTNDISEANRLLEKNCIRAEVKSVNRAYIINNLKYYCYGFVLRSDSFVNKTASPIKFMEYVISGVIPITTSYAGDYSKFFEKTICNIDIIDNNSSISDRLVALLNQESINISLKKAENFTWQYHKHNLFGC